MQAQYIAIMFLCRLRALRDEAGEEGEGPGSSPPQQEPALKFRNYSVRDQKIEHPMLAPALPPEYTAPEPEAAVKKKPQVKTYSSSPACTSKHLRTCKLV